MSGLPESYSGAARKPKKLFIAHRSSPSEFTTLMVEQYNLQKQMEQTQAQQKLQLQHSSYVSLTQPPLAPNDSYRSHSRTPSYTGQGHRRTGSGGGSSSQQQQGHARRHSLGLTEAMKAAASQKQSNMAHSISQGGEKLPSRAGSLTQQHLAPDAGYRFPNTLEPDLDLSAGAYKSLAYGQQQFKFPPDNTSDSIAHPASSAWVPPVPSFGQTASPDRAHNRRSSHFRTNSRNYDAASTASNINTNWRSQQLPMGGNHQRSSLINNSLSPPSFFVPGHKEKSSSFGGGNGSISSMSHFNATQGGGANSGGRKLLFAPYLPQLSLPELIAEGRLVTGILRVNKKNRSDAYVSTDGLLDADIFICGSKDRNRALEGDLVAVELLVVDEVWELKKEKEEKKRRKDNISTKATATSVLSDDIHNDATSTLAVDTDKGGDSELEGLGRRGSLKQRPTMKKNDDVEVEGQALLLVEEEEINDESKPLYAGHVVAVVDRIPGQIFAGTLGLLRPAQAAQAANDKRIGKEPSVQTPKAPKIVWFKPTDKRVPLIAIPTEQAPRDFVENHESYSDTLFVALIKRWPITSLHPFGTLVTKLGKIDEPQIGIELILRDNNFLCDEYAGEDELGSEYLALAFGLVPDVDSEVCNPRRTEYSSHYIVAFTQNSQFVDHALHVKRLSDTRIELGFHGADIAYFVQQGSSLERKAKKRSTSVFLPQKVSNLYPKQLMDLASFKENEKGLAISVVFEIDTTSFEVRDVHIHESVIVPKALVTYDAVDAILDNGVLPALTSATCDYIKTFGLIAKEFRRQRLQDRSLGSTPTLALLDQLDDEKVKLHLNIFERSSAQLMISEIGHRVNQTVATQIHTALGDAAFLRRHALPTLQKIEAFARKAANLGFKIDTSTSASLQKLILAIEDPLKRQCIEILLYKCMPSAKYFIAKTQEPENFGYCYLNLPIYTHFTAPLRRFADLVVQRQLKRAIAESNTSSSASSSSNERDIDDLDGLKTIADYCNFKKDCAASAQEQAIHLLLSQTINDMSEHAGQILVMGIVVQVYESSFDVVVPEFGIEKRVHGDQLPLVKAEFDKSQRVLELYWEKGVDSATYVPPDERLSLSYRSSIKNKYRTSALEAARIQHNTMVEKNTIAPLSITEKLAAMNIGAPKFSNLLGLLVNFGATNDDLLPYLRDCITRVDGHLYVQEIRELKQVPVLLRAEIGMSLPCLTVRILNPFAE